MCRARKSSPCSRDGSSFPERLRNANCPRFSGERSRAFLIHGVNRKFIRCIQSADPDEAARLRRRFGASSSVDRSYASTRYWLIKVPTLQQFRLAGNVPMVTSIRHFSNSLETGGSLTPPAEWDSISHLDRAQRASRLFDFAFFFDNGSVA